MRENTHCRDWEASRRIRLASATVLCLLLGLAGCASIDRFRAEPRNACIGDQVTLEWKARWRARIDSEPTLPETGPKPSQGSAVYAVSEPTRFVLTASGLFGSKTAEQDIDVAPPEHTFGDVASCDGERLLTEFTLDTQVSREFTVSTVGNVLKRTLTVEKDGHAATVSAGGKSGALSGQGVLGKWVLTSPLSSGESCQAALGSVRQRLRVRIALECGG